MSLLNYHAFQDWKVYEFHDDSDEDWTFGFELEVISKDDIEDQDLIEMTQKLHEEFGEIFIYERDGSLDGEGFEIISQPMTWNYFKENISIFENLLKRLREYSMLSHSGNLCGLHVHVGKNRLGKSLQEIETTIVNINLVLEKYCKELYQFSRRNNFQWANFISFDTFDKTLVKEKTKKDLKGSYSRYMALNLCNEKTIEFRFLRGTLKETTFLHSLNMIKNIVEFSKKRAGFISLRDIFFNSLSADDISICEEYVKQRGIDIETKKILLLEEIPRVRQQATMTASEIIRKWND